MSDNTRYIPTEWFNGDTITAEKLNKIENEVKDITHVLSGHVLGEYKGGIHGPIFVPDKTSETNLGEWMSIEELLDIEGVPFHVLMTGICGEITAVDLEEFGTKVSPYISTS